MQCTHLVKLVKKWYLDVHAQTMAPARMISFIEDHARSCLVCQADPDLPGEIARIRAIVAPPDPDANDARA